MKRILATIFATVLTIFGFWLGGFDFDQRGAFAVFVYLISLTAFIGTWFWPEWKP